MSNAKDREKVYTKAFEKAAQLWCLSQFSDREMDSEFATAIALLMVDFSDARIAEAVAHAQAEMVEEAAGMVHKGTATQSFYSMGPDALAAAIRRLKPRSLGEDGKA